MSWFCVKNLSNTSQLMWPCKVKCPTLTKSSHSDFKCKIEYKTKTNNKHGYKLVLEKTSLHTYLVIYLHSLKRHENALISVYVYIQSFAVPFFESVCTQYNNVYVEIIH